MKYIILIMAMLLVFGCAGAPILPLEEEAEEGTKEKECRTVQEEVPTEVEECGEIAYTEEVCDKRILEYTTKKPPIAHFCMLDGVCGGKALSTCTACAKAMTRCGLNITNEDTNKDGTWKVGATFYVDGAKFKRDPITKTIGPGETVNFDFQHFYVPGKPIDSATCDIYVIEEAIIDDCQDVTRTRMECINVTKTVTVDREVCE